MNYKKCMKNNTCKTCSDYMFCKGEKKRGGGNGKRKQFKTCTNRERSKKKR